jgi:hypothetical protein
MHDELQLQQAAMSRLLQEIRKMNSNLLKKLIAAAITGLFLVSVGVSAGEKTNCGKQHCSTAEKCDRTQTPPKCVPK